MVFKFACFILLVSFPPVVPFVLCYKCGSVFSSCDENKVEYCEGDGCAKFEAELSGHKLIVKYCEQGSEGCRKETMATIRGTLCYCHSNYCNHSSRHPMQFAAVYFSIVYIVLKTMILLYT